jgi:hypothetical protein
MANRNMVDSLGKNLVFLVSAPRAGSTLLGAMLGSNPRVVCPAETWVQLLLTFFSRNGVKADAPFDHDLAVSAFLEAAGEPASQAACRSFAVGLYNQFLAAKPGARVLVDKTPRYYHILDELAGLWPNASFVWVQRNPLDIVASCKDTWSISVSEQMGSVVTPHSYDTTLSFDRLLKFFAKAKRAHVVRYEDLTKDPGPVLKNLCRKIGLTYSPAMLEYGSNARLMASYRTSTFGDKKVLGFSATHRQSVGRWRDILVPSEVRSVLKTLGTTCFLAQSYRRELLEACSFAKMRIIDLEEDGSWRRKLQYRASTQKASKDSVYFTAARTVRAQAGEIAQLRAQLEKQARELGLLAPLAEATKNERNLLQAQLADLQRNFGAVEKDRIERGRIIDQQGRKLTKLEGEFDGRLAELKTLYVASEKLKNERNLFQAQLADLQGNFATAEKDRTERGRIIDQQGRKLTKLEGEFDARLKELKSLYEATEVHGRGKGPRRTRAAHRSAREETDQA